MCIFAIAVETETELLTYTLRRLTGMMCISWNSCSSTIPSRPSWQFKALHCLLPSSHVTPYRHAWLRSLDAVYEERDMVSSFSSRTPLSVATVSGIDVRRSGGATLAFSSRDRMMSDSYSRVQRKAIRSPGGDTIATTTPSGGILRDVLLNSQARASRMRIQPTDRV